MVADGSGSSTDDQVRNLLKFRFKNFKGSNCDKVFGEVITGYNTNDFEAEAQKTEFYQRYESERR